MHGPSGILPEVKPTIAAAFILWILCAAASASAQLPPDVVRLRDGGLFRGTISQYEPGRHVVIVLPNGEERRFEAAQIEFAGPAAEMPAPSAPAPTPAPPAQAPAPPAQGPPAPLVVQIAPPLAFPVRFESERPQLQIFRIVGAEQRLRVTATQYGASSYLESNAIFERVCTTPCEVPFLPGFYGLGVSGGGGIVRPGDPALHVAGPTRVHVAWTDRELMRIIGFAVAIAGGVLGAAGLIGGLTAFVQDTRQVGWRDFGAVSGGVLLVSLSVGLPLALWNDSYRLSQDPPIPAELRR